MHSLVLYTTSNPLHAKPHQNIKNTPTSFFTHCQMGRQANDPTTTVNSSIALLQERFRQLEKVKERREGKQLLKLLSSENTSSSIMQNPSSQNSQQHQQQQQSRMVPPLHRPILHDSLSLGLNFSTQGDHNTMNMKPPPSSNLWPQGSPTSRNFDTSDVDTSLHL